MAALATPDAAAWRKRVPHAGAMLLVTGVVRHADDETACEVVIAEQKMFRDADGSVPGWFALVERTGGPHLPTDPRFVPPDGALP